MARVGLPNWHIRTGHPVRHDETWRETMAREQWDHRYHSKNASRPFGYYTCKDWATTTAEEYNKTAHIMNQTYTSAAGMSSYHHNVFKPLSNPVYMGRTQSTQFEGGKHSTFIQGQVPRDENGIPRSSSERHLPKPKEHLKDLGNMTQITYPPIGEQHYAAHNKFRGQWQHERHDNPDTQRQLRRVHTHDSVFDYVKHNTNQKRQWIQSHDDDCGF